MAIADRTRTDGVGRHVGPRQRPDHPEQRGVRAAAGDRASRTEASGGKTSPEELLAVAHSSCFAMALNLVLGEQQTPAAKTTVSARVTLDEVDGKPTITTSAITVRATVPGVDQEKFQAAVDEAAALGPVSRLFAGAQISIQSSLEQG